MRRSLFLSLCLLCILASLSLSEHSAADLLQKRNSPGKEPNGNRRNRMEDVTRLARGGGYGSESGNNGGSDSSHPNGGAGMVPVYAGVGAKNHNRNVHRNGSGGSSLQRCSRIHIFISATLAIFCILV